MEYTIINADMRHLDDLEKLEKQCFSMPWTKQMLIGELPDGTHEFIVAEANGKVIGYIGMQFVLDEGYISNVAVSPAHRREGIARALINELMARAEALKLSFVTLEVRSSNTPAISLYSSFGFVPVGERKNYYQFPKENAILMTKFLK